MKFEIKNRFTLKVIFECEADSWKAAVELAIEKKANLSEANLSRANLSEANLSEADLSWANLSEANLSRANLSRANLSRANLSRADLSRANLSRADLSWANLSEADLSWANLSEADLSEANLSRANLSRADLSTVKKDYFMRLSAAKNEVVGLYKALVDGKVDGSVYTGECACFCGTIANIRGENYEQMAIDLRPDSNCPTERWFLGIRKGDTPENNQVSRITSEWTTEFMKENIIAIPKREVVWS